MQLVILAAGFGTRFGGLKQLAPVGPNGEAIMDYTAATAHSCGFNGAVVIIREEIENEVRAHVAARWPADFSVTYAYQPPTKGTAPAVLAAQPLVSGPFAVANADDLYGADALRMIARHFASSPADDRHLLVAYRLSNTVLGEAAVKRGVCAVSNAGELAAIDELVITGTGNDTYGAVPLGAESESTPRALTGDAYVSMNLWGFHERFFDDLDRAMKAHSAEEDAAPELLLPDVVRSAVASEQEHVRVVVTEARCIGITNPDDLAIVREQINEATK